MLDIYVYNILSVSKKIERTDKTLYDYGNSSSSSNKWTSMRISVSNSVYSDSSSSTSNSSSSIVVTWTNQNPNYAVLQKAIQICRQSSENFN